jgi:predicted exporter
MKILRFEKYFTLIYESIGNNKKFIPRIIILLTVAAVTGIGFIHFDGNIELMLPDEDNIHRTINFLRDSSLSDKIIISLALKSDDKGKKELIHAVEQLKDSLKPPLFTRIYSGFSVRGLMEEILNSDYLPQIATEEDLVAIDNLITRETVSKKLHEIYRQMFRPQSIFTASVLNSDPLGIKLILLDKLKTGYAAGYKATVEKGNFISPDGRHAMIIAHTSIPVTDSSGSKILMKTLREKLNQLPEYIAADIIGGHVHTVSNEKVIRRDIRLTVTIAAIAFLVLFFTLFRDIRAILVFLIPVVSVLISINLSSFIIGNISYWVVGLGTVIAGISVDYGIHVFIAVRNSGKASHVIRHLAGPVSMGAVTTMGIFAAFFFSDIQGYHQLALFSIISIVIALILSLFVLPHFLSEGKSCFQWKLGSNGRMGRLNLPARSVVALWAVLIIAASVLAFNVRFDSNVVKLDGSEPEVFRAEEKFRRIWGGLNNQAIFVVSDSSYERALESNDLIFQKAVQTIGKENFASLSMFWPSKKLREENVARWNKFWKEGRESTLKRLIKEEGARYQFSDTAFSTFFDNLYVDKVDRETTGEFLSGVKERFVQKNQKEYKILSFFPDSDEYIKVLSEISRQHPGTFIVSRKALSRSISESISSEVKLFAMIATILIIILTFLFLKSLKKSLLALVPVATSVLILLGFMSLTGLSLNIANMIAGIVAMGLCIDYGIFMTYRYRHELKRSAVQAVSISAITTLIGAGVLLFAKHPALYSIGITLVVGVAAGFISSIIVIPALERILLVSSVEQ